MDELLIKARAGDQSALEKLVANYKGLIRAAANKFFLVGGDKDDLLQEGMLGFFCAVNKYDESKGSFPAFAELCVVRYILNAVKRDSGLRQKPLSNYVDVDALSDLPDGLNTPLESLLKKEYNQRLLSIVNDKLTKLERSVLTMFADGFSYEDIANRLNCSVKSVDGALQRARKKILEMLN